MSPSERLVLTGVVGSVVVTILLGRRNIGRVGKIGALEGMAWCSMFPLVVAGDEVGVRNGGVHVVQENIGTAIETVDDATRAHLDGLIRSLSEKCILNFASMLATCHRQFQSIDGRLILQPSARNYDFNGRRRPGLHLVL